MKLGAYFSVLQSGFYAVHLFCYLQSILVCVCVLCMCTCVCVYVCMCVCRVCVYVCVKKNKNTKNRILDLAEMPSWFYMSLIGSCLYAKNQNVPLAGLNELATQHALPPVQLLVLTSSGLSMYVKSRPIDELRDILCRRYVCMYVCMYVNRHFVILSLCVCVCLFFLMEYVCVFCVDKHTHTHIHAHTHILNTHTHTHTHTHILCVRSPVCVWKYIL